MAPTSPAAVPTSPAAPPTTAPPTPKPAVRSPLSPPVKVTVGDNQTLGAASLYIAQERGYYREEGVEVDLNPMPVATVLQSLATSQVAFALANPDPTLFNALDRGLDIRLVMALAQNQPGDKPAAFLVRKDLIDDGSYKSPKDLKGKKVAIPALQSQFYVNLFMSQDGLSAADVDLVTLNVPDIPAAFASKSIDAAWNTEPSNTITEQQGWAKIVAATGDLLPGGVGSALALSPDFGRDQPEAAQRFVIATLRGMRDYYHAFIKKDVDKAPFVDILIAHTPIKDPKLYDVIGVNRIAPNPTVDFTTWKLLQDYYVKIGLQPRVVDANQYIDTSYIERALQVLGRE
jgi:NitT/TauT family transport system substrate-binding protein